MWKTCLERRQYIDHPLEKAQWKQAHQLIGRQATQYSIHNPPTCLGLHRTYILLTVSSSVHAKLRIQTKTLLKKIGCMSDISVFISIIKLFAIYLKVLAYGLDQSSVYISLYLYMHNISALLFAALHYACPRILNSCLLLLTSWFASSGRYTFCFVQTSLRFFLGMTPEARVRR